MFNIVTPCCRPQNLPAIEASIRRQGVPLSDITWWICYDKNPLTGIVKVSDHDGLKVYEGNYTSKTSVAGHGQRNACLDNMLDMDSWFYSVDDDNIMPDNFLREVANTSNTDAVIVDQINKEGVYRLYASPERMTVCNIDTAQFIVKRGLIGDLRFIASDYCADGLFIEALYKASPEKFTFINKPLCYYNYLA